jgi:hypothetical protein
MYTTIYWMGGSLRGKWQRCLPVATKEEAENQAASIRRGGRPALVNLTTAWDTIGLPEAPRYVQ